jgi:hypothetical protein
VNWINRYIDEPLLNGAANTLRIWHVYTRQPPESLEPTWNVVVLSGLLLASGHVLTGGAFALSFAALVMLAVPSLRTLLALARAGHDGYGARQYKSLRARAINKRETEWSVRMTVLFAAIALPFFARTDDPVGAAFLMGASVWFVLTGPFKTYLEAAEPPKPDDGDRSVREILQFG